MDKKQLNIIIQKELRQDGKYISQSLILKLRSD